MYTVETGLIIFIVETRQHLVVQFRNRSYTLSSSGTRYSIGGRAPASGAQLGRRSHPVDIAGIDVREIRGTIDQATGTVTGVS